MNWEAISTVADIVGVLVVVVTLAYLAAQVRQGNVFAKLQARQRMIDQARELGANAIVNVRFNTSSIAQGASELYIYGTAVRVE